ncbi:MAG: toprim domain-containing protein, partial [Vicinamibacteria bacterium]
VILTESVFDALSFHQAGIATAIPIYGTNGFTSDHLDLLKREEVRRVILALDSDEAGRKGTDALKGKLQAAGLAVRVASFPAGIKDANELLVSRNGDVGEAFRRILDEAEPRTRPGVLPAPLAPPAPSPCYENAQPPQQNQQLATTPVFTNGGAPQAQEVLSEKPPTPAEGVLVLSRDGLRYEARVQSTLLGRLRVTVKVTRGETFHVDTLDLYASRSRSEFARRAGKAFGVDSSSVEAALLTLVVEAEKSAGEEKTEEATSPPMTEVERQEALALARRPDLLEEVSRDIDALGYVGERTLMRLLYLIAISRKLDDPSSAIVLSQSGAGKSGATEVIEKLTPPEDAVLLTRLTPQSLYYTEPGFLDHKLVIIEERYGSMEADYSVRVLQSRKKLSVAVPIKDPQTGNLKTKQFTVEARAAFIEATTAASVNHENATRCFELQMDESEEQTRRIHARMSQLRTEAGLLRRQEVDRIVRRHWNLQRVLEPLSVVIPYAGLLTFPSSWLRTRRDY